MKLPPKISDEEIWAANDKHSSHSGTGRATPLLHPPQRMALC